MIVNSSPWQHFEELHTLALWCDMRLNVHVRECTFSGMCTCMCLRARMRVPQHMCQWRSCTAAGGSNKNWFQKSADGSEALTSFDLIENVFDVRAFGVGYQRAVTEGPWAQLVAATHEAHDLTHGVHISIHILYTRMCTYFYAHVCTYFCTYVYIHIYTNVWTQMST